jgi:transcriptional regulator with XRE-family HTH domain
MEDGRRRSFGDVLRSHRLALGLTQETIAERARMSVQAIGALERGERQALYRTTIDLLASALALSPDQRRELDSSARRARGRGARVQQRRVGNIAPAVGSLVGRDGDVRGLSALITAGSSRLITIVGPGGIGKSRVALETARASADVFDGDVWLVELASIARPAPLAAPVEAAQTLETTVAAAVAGALLISERSDQPIAETVRSALLSRKALIVIDNCEHVLAGVRPLLRARVSPQFVSRLAKALRLQPYQEMTLFRLSFLEMYHLSGE